MTALPFATQLSTPSRATLGLEDWDLLFSAVCGRLRVLASATAAADVASMRIGVPECVLALEQLHGQLQLAWACRQPFEVDLLESRPTRLCSGLLGEFAGAQLRSLEVAAASGDAGSSAAVA